MSAPREQRLVAVADMHMAAGPHEAFFEDERLAAFLAALAAEAGGDAAPPRLLILGDCFDFSRVELSGTGGRRLDSSVGAALEKLPRIAEAHAAVFDGLQGLVAAGGRIEFVPGNHDLELLLPPVWEELRGLIASGSDGGLTLRPWIFHVPALAYAEHGHQHHDPNRVPDLLRVPDRAAAPVPAGTALGEWGIERRVEGATRAAGRLAARLGGWAGYLGRARAGRRTYAEALAAHAGELGIPADVLADIHALGPDGPVRAAGRTARRLAAERLSRRRRTPYMQSAMLAVHRALAARGAGVPFYLAGHTHVAADVPLEGGARHLNPGTWSAMRPAGAPVEHRYVEILATEARSRARLRSWELG